MTDFKYTAGGQSGSFPVDEEKDLGRMAVEAETKLLAALEGKDLAVDADEKKYLRSRIARAITRDLLSKDIVDLGDVKVRGGIPSGRERLLPPPEERSDISSQRPPTAGSYTYTLTHVKSGKVTRRNYSPDQSIGAMYADLRQMYNLGLHEQVVITQQVNGIQQEIPTTTLLRNLSVKDLYWDTKSID